MILDTRGQPFDLDLTLSAGQAFRWKREADGWWSGIVCGRLVIIRQADGKDGEVEFNCISGREAEVASLLNRYFRLDDPITDIYKRIGRHDSMRHLVNEYHGLRLLRQQPWECLISYICSTNNKVEQISNIVERICAEFGEPVDGGIMHAFPTSQRLAKAGSQKVAKLRLGLDRAKNICLAAEAVESKTLNLTKMRENPSCYSAVRILEGIKGVGTKVSDCVALFSLDKLEAFPVDTNIRSGMQELYFKGNSGVSDGQIRQKADALFGTYAGYAGQFIFCDKRKKERASLLKGTAA